jgi:hypothetical protein
MNNPANNPEDPSRHHRLYGDLVSGTRKCLSITRFFLSFFHSFFLPFLFRAVLMHIFMNVTLHSALDIKCVNPCTFLVAE